MRLPLGGFVGGGLGGLVVATSSIGIHIDGVTGLTETRHMWKNFGRIQFTQTIFHTPPQPHEQYYAFQDIS